MGGSILGRKDRMSLDNGMELRLLSAWEVMELRRQARELAAGEEGRELALCSNACLVARALEQEGVPFFEDGGQVLRTLRIEEIEALAKRWAQFNREENPGLDCDEDEAETLKKN